MLKIYLLFYHLSSKFATVYCFFLAFYCRMVYTIPIKFVYYLIHQENQAITKGLFMKNNVKPALIIKSILYLFVCWLTGFFINAFFPNSYLKYGVIMCFAFGFCSVGASLCIYADFCYKAGAKANTKSARIMNQIETDKNFGAVLGIAPTAINYLYVILLWLSKFNILGFDFYPIFKTLTLYFMPLSYLVAPNVPFLNENGGLESRSVPAWDLSMGAMILFTLLPILFEITCWAAYYLGYTHLSLKEIILYGRKSQE